MVKACSPAKINLSLEITGRRADGYHLIHTVMQGLTLHETVEVHRREQPGIKLSITGADIPTGHTNTAYRAAAAFFEHTGIHEFGLEIHIEKQIPIGAGLAGGSADAAAVLTAMNELTGAHLTLEKLMEIGAYVGADVPFCILGGTAVGIGTGTTLTPLPKLPDCAIVIAKPKDSVSTAQAYSLIDGAKIPYNFDRSLMEKSVRAGDLDMVGKGLFNAFEIVTDLPGVCKIKNLMLLYNTLGCQMTGSGSAVFGLFRDDKIAQNCADNLREEFEDVFVCRPESRGSYIL